MVKIFKLEKLTHRIQQLAQAFIEFYLDERIKNRIRGDCETRLIKKTCHKTELLISYLTSEERKKKPFRKLSTLLNHSR